MIVIKNTYPVHPKVPSAQVGEGCEWVLDRNCYRLMQKGACIFATAPVNKEGRLLSNGKQPTLVGTIAQVKSKGYILKLKKEEHNVSNTEYVQ